MPKGTASEAEAALHQVQEPQEIQRPSPFVVRTTRVCGGPEGGAREAHRRALLYLSMKAWALFARWEEQVSEEK